GPVDITTRPQSDVVEEAVAREARKGYDLLFIGVEPAAQEDAFDDKVARIAGEFKGAFAIAAARGSHRRPGIGRALGILVPATGGRAFLRPCRRRRSRALRALAALRLELTGAARGDAALAPVYRWAAS